MTASMPRASGQATRNDAVQEMTRLIKVENDEIRQKFPHLSLPKNTT